MGTDVVDLKNAFEGNGILKVGSLVVSGDALGEATFSSPLMLMMESEEPKHTIRRVMKKRVLRTAPARPVTAKFTGAGAFLSREDTTPVR